MYISKLIFKVLECIILLNILQDAVEPCTILSKISYGILLTSDKIESIIDHVVENDICLCTVTETLFNDVDSVSIAQLSVAGYFFNNFSRQSQNRGGGTEILFRDSVNVSLVDGRENKSQVLRIF